MRVALLVSVMWVICSGAASANTFTRADAAPINAAYEAATDLGRDVGQAGRQARSQDEMNCFSLLGLMVSGFAGDLHQLSMAIENSALMRDPFDEQVILVSVRTQAGSAMGMASAYRDLANQLRGSCPRTETFMTYSDRANQLFRASYEIVRPIAARLGD